MFNLISYEIILLNFICLLTTLYIAIRKIEEALKKSINTPVHTYIHGCAYLDSSSLPALKSRGKRKLRRYVGYEEFRRIIFNMARGDEAPPIGVKTKRTVRRERCTPSSSSSVRIRRKWWTPSDLRFGRQSMQSTKNRRARSTRRRTRLSYTFQIRIRVHIRELD